jgi:hypothetical protein
MANTVLNPSIVAKAAVRILDNELVMARQVWRAFEPEFAKKINGYEAGDTISIRKPNQFAVRTGAVVAPVGGQDVTEGKLTMVVGSQKGVDFKFSSTELTLKIEQLADRVIRPAMVQLANAVDQDLMALYKDVYNWVTPQSPLGATASIKAFSDFRPAPERLDNGSVPQNDRSAVFSPTDFWGVAQSQTALFMQQIGTEAYRRGEIGQMGGIDTYMAQNVPTHTVGIKTGTPIVAGANQQVNYSAVLNTESVPGIQSLNTSGWTASQTGILKKGDVFTISGVFAVNPITKAKLPYLQQFVVQADVNSDAGTLATISIAPAIILNTLPASTNVNFAFATVDIGQVANLPAGGTITVQGSTVTGYFQNLVFQENAFALAVVPMVKPPGAVDVARETYKGLSVRVIPYYDGVNDISNFRLDILYGVKTVDPRLATRLSGSL